jgi:hypothetical protein
VCVLMMGTCAWPWVWRQGDWRGISRHYVLSRNPTQVASHAQKYFIRQSNNLNKRKRRSSLFDIVSNVACAHQVRRGACALSNTRHSDHITALPADWMTCSTTHERSVEAGCVHTSYR